MMLFGRSLMYNKNKNGPVTVPCGTPGVQLLGVMYVYAHYLRLVGYMYAPSDKPAPMLRSPHLIHNMFGDKTTVRDFVEYVRIVGENQVSKKFSAFPCFLMG